MIALIIYLAGIASYVKGVALLIAGILAFALLMYCAPVTDGEPKKSIFAAILIPAIIAITVFVLYPEKDVLYAMYGIKGVETSTINAKGEIK